LNKHQLLALFALITFGSLILFWAMLIKTYGWLITLAGLLSLLTLVFTLWLVKK